MDFRIDKKVVIDAYRGGDDVGSSANGIVEKDYNLDISKYIYDRLKSLNIPVSITRNTDETLDMTARVNKIKLYFFFFVILFFVGGFLLNNIFKSYSKLITCLGVAYHNSVIEKTDTQGHCYYEYRRHNSVLGKGDSGNRQHSADGI